MPAGKRHCTDGYYGFANVTLIVALIAHVMFPLLLVVLSTLCPCGRNKMLSDKVSRIWNQEHPDRRDLGGILLSLQQDDKIYDWWSNCFSWMCKKSSDTEIVADKENLNQQRTAAQPVRTFVQSCAHWWLHVPVFLSTHSQDRRALFITALLWFLFWLYHSYVLVWAVVGAVVNALWFKTWLVVIVSVLLSLLIAKERTAVQKLFRNLCSTKSAEPEKSADDRVVSRLLGK
jgi:hypothetical protein